MIFLISYNLGVIFVVLATMSIGHDDTVKTQSSFSEHDDFANTKSDSRITTNQPLNKQEEVLQKTHSGWNCHVHVELKRKLVWVLFC